MMYDHLPQFCFKHVDAIQGGDFQTEKDLTTDVPGVALPGWR